MDNRLRAIYFCRVFILSLCVLLVVDFLAVSLFLFPGSFLAFTITIGLGRNPDCRNIVHRQRGLRRLMGRGFIDCTDRCVIISTTVCINTQAGALGIRRSFAREHRTVFMNNVIGDRILVPMRMVFTLGLLQAVFFLHYENDTPGL
jgi:hypothetical protein